MHAALLAVPLLLAPVTRPAALAADRPELEVELFGQVVVPMNHSARHVDVEVHIGDRGPFLFQLDTYASTHACIDVDLARELGLEVVETGLNSDGRTTRAVEYVGVDELRLGEATFRNLTVLVDDYPSIPTASGRPLQGLLGFGLFEDLLLTVDYPGERVVLRRGVLDRNADGVVPFVDRGVPDVRMMVGKRRLSFGVDTGMDATMRLFATDIEDLALEGDAPVVGVARTVYSEVQVRGDYLVDRVSVAGLDFDANFAIFSPNAEGMRRLVGYGLFGDCALTFDRARGLIRFERPSHAGYDPPPGWERAWLGTFAADDRGRSVEIHADDGGLLVRFEEGVELRPTPIGEGELGFSTNMARLHHEELEGVAGIRAERWPGMVPSWTGQPVRDR